MSDVVGMYGAVTGDTQDAIAMIDVPQDGFLIGIDWDYNLTQDAANERSEVELSFISTNQLTTNDVRGRLSSISVQSELLTSVGVHAFSIQKWLGSFDIALAGGERLFLHAVSTSGVTGRVRCNLFIDFTGGVTRRSARRR